MSQTTEDAYSGNTTMADAAAWLAGKRHVVITTHFKPDGDAVGSSLALARALERRAWGSRVELWYSGQLPDFLPEIAGDTPYRHLDKQPASGDDNPDAVVVVDTGAWSQVEAVREWLRARADRALIVDHHLNGDAGMADRRMIDAKAAAAAQLIAGLCAELLRLPPARFPADIAAPLYLGLATDTGWYRYSNVTPSVMRLAADFIEAGVAHTELFRIVEQRDRPGRLRLFGRALASLEFADHGRVALMRLSERDFIESDAAPGDTGGFADRLLTIETVLVAVVLSEARDHNAERIAKVSMRSKDGPGAVDVNEVTTRLGGGGHARASGARIHGTLDEARDAVLRALGAASGG
ncbi:MAG TPA: bifunctional oligoribonuclease/PAP phosphatase NrnA [Phycisphaerales bacterium]|nr:bifunctional oligoribonuclease/PAP phosphatase NrnA [Phycisphaerales bacterium]